MAEEAVEKAPQQTGAPITGQGKAVQAKALAQQSAHSPDDEHYEEVSEYRIGEGPPPLFLVVVFIFIVVWALFSWIPFFGY